ncbi:MAG: SO2930 family diheme c-type cytochrome [Candidatus Latescibacterota bacterium]
MSKYPHNFIGCLLCLITLLSCAPSQQEWTPPNQLSEYGLFQDTGATQVPMSHVIPYDINTPLFSDYTTKYRFIKIPQNTSATYHATDTFDLPVGTIIAKTFAYPQDMRDLSKGQRLLETPLLIHRPNGWIGLPYVWNEQQTDATLEIAGETLDVQWTHLDGQTRSNTYMIPNVNQCKQCHDQHGTLKPIGIRARHLNRDYPYDHITTNQLTYWSRIGILKNAPNPQNAPKLAQWHNPNTGTLNERARAYLEINCAHCHSPEGRAWSAGIDLTASQTDPSLIGIYKTSTAAGAGTGGRDYDIVPGKPDASIITYRIASTQPNVAMPELGRRLVHTEGLALIEQWIAAMPQE